MERRVQRDLFSRSYSRASDAKIEFRHFKELAPSGAIRGVARRIPRFQALEQYFNFYVDGRFEETLQIWFGRRIMRRRDIEGKTVIEDGPALLYSLGATGDIAVSIYPAKSNISRQEEDHIYLRIGYFTGYELFGKLSDDLKYLVAYGTVSSLDAEETHVERLKVWWLRHTRAMQVDGEFKKAIIFQYFGNVVKSLVQSWLIALLKSLAILFMIALLIYFGKPYLAALLMPSR